MARKAYDDASKVAAAEPVRERGYAIKKAAPSPGGDPGSIRTRARMYAPAPTPPAPGAAPAGLRREGLRPREEDRRLLTGRGTSKKATASFARDRS